MRTYVLRNTCPEIAAFCCPVDVVVNLSILLQPLTNARIVFYHSPNEQSEIRKTVLRLRASGICLTASVDTQSPHSAGTFMGDIANTFHRFARSTFSPR